MVSSSMGHDLSLRRQVGRYLSRAMLDCRHRNSIAIVACDSAIEPMAIHAASLFRVPMLRLALRNCSESEHGVLGSRETDEVVQVELTGDTKLDRDELVIRLANRVDVLWARRGGKIARYSRERIERLNDTSTRVAVQSRHLDAAPSLVAAGGIGWLLGAPHRRANDAMPSASESYAAADSAAAGPDWMRESGEWLVHCTRGLSHSWPGETAQQFQDEMLLGTADVDRRGAYQTLTRIVRSRQLLASCIASNRDWPIVCFSELPLVELLRQRQYRSHLHRWDYEPLGIAIRLSTAKRLGIRPVHYGDPAERERLPLEERYLFQARGKTFDWTREREWRSSRSVDLESIPVEDIRVFTETREQACELKRLCHWRIDATPACVFRADP